MNPTPGKEANALLAARVRACVPQRHPAFRSLLQLLSIEASHDVPTAAVTVGARSRLLLNPDFVASHCHTDAQLSMLVLHELYHVLMGHTRMFRRPTHQANWAFDCVINAQLCRLHPDAEHCSFFAGLAADSGPWQLIGPPPGWPSHPRYAADALGQLHRQLYDDRGATTAELFALLDTMGLELSAAAEGRLLGSHAADGDMESPYGDPLGADPDLLAEVSRLVARWPRVMTVAGTDDGGVAAWSMERAQTDVRRRRALQALLRRVADGPEGPWQRQWCETAAHTPLPQAGDRRAQVQRLMGATPVLWTGPLLQETRAPVGQISVYLDVSGSMHEELPSLLDALQQSAPLLRWPLLGFSTQVHALDPEDVRAGRYFSTGGTHIGCVVRHLLENPMQRALILTDGAVQDVPADLRRRLQRERPHVHVGLTPTGDRSCFDTLGWAVTRLPERSVASK
jgi:Putative metallopeptidase domain